MKIKAVIMAILALAAVAALSGCKDETMLENYSSDTFELGEGHSLSFNDFDIGDIDVGNIDVGDIDIGDIDLGNLF